MRGTVKTVFGDEEEKEKGWAERKFAYDNMSLLRVLLRMCGCKLRPRQDWRTIGSELTDNF